MQTHLTTRPRFEDLTGQTFGRLTVVSRAEDSTTGRIRWLCRCQCGQDKICHAGNLKSGKTRSCGCFQKERVSSNAATAAIPAQAQSFWDIANHRLQNLADMAEYHDTAGNVVLAEREPDKEKLAVSNDAIPDQAEPAAIPPLSNLQSTTEPVIDKSKIPSNPLVGSLLTETLFNVIDQLILLSSLSSAVFIDLRIKSGLDSSIEACVRALQFEAERII